MWQISQVEKLTGVPRRDIQRICDTNSDVFIFSPLDSTHGRRHFSKEDLLKIVLVGQYKKIGYNLKEIQSAFRAIKEAQQAHNDESAPAPESEAQQAHISESALAIDISAPHPAANAPASTPTPNASNPQAPDTATQQAHQNPSAPLSNECLPSKFDAILDTQIDELEEKKRQLEESIACAKELKFALHGRTIQQAAEVLIVQFFVRAFLRASYEAYDDYFTEEEIEELNQEFMERYGVSEEDLCHMSLQELEANAQQLKARGLMMPSEQAMKSVLAQWKTFCMQRPDPTIEATLDAFDALLEQTEEAFLSCIAEDQELPDFLFSSMKTTVWSVIYETLGDASTQLLIELFLEADAYTNLVETFRNYALKRMLPQMEAELKEYDKDG